MWIKLCGIVRPEDFDCAISLGADAAGVVAVPGTPRCVSIAEANALSRRPRNTTKLTLVLQDAERDYANEMIASALPDLLQFHGQETPGEAESFGLPYIKAIRNLDETTVTRLTEHQNAIAWLLDVAGSPENQTAKMAHPFGRVILAGGLRPDTVAQEIRAWKPWGIDVSRGIEIMPREKDHRLMKEFVHAAKS